MRHVPWGRDCRAVSLAKGFVLGVAESATIVALDDEEG